MKQMLSSRTVLLAQTGICSWIPPTTSVIGFINKCIHDVILSTSFTWDAFPTVLKEFPYMLSTCRLLFLHSAVQLIPNHLNWHEVGWLWRPGHLMQHSITLSLGQIALTQPGGVLGHCPIEKQMIVPLSPNLVGWRIAAVCSGSHAG